MARRKSKVTACDELIPTSSFADIAFLLIVYFMLVMAMIQTVGFQTELPAGKKSEQEPEKTTTVQLHDNQIRLNDEPTDLQGLRTELRRMNFAEKTGNDKIVMLEATGNVHYQDYFAVMSAVTAAKANLVIVQEDTDQEDETP